MEKIYTCNVLALIYFRIKFEPNEKNMFHSVFLLYKFDA